MTDEPLIDALQLQDDLKFSDVDISSGLMEQAGLFARYATLSAKAARASDRAKLKREVTESKVAKKLRKLAAELGEKTSEAKIHSELGTEPEVLKARMAEIEAKSMADLAKNALEAFKQRRDMMIQVGVSIREELKGPARVAMQKAEDERRKDKLSGMFKKGGDGIEIEVAAED